MPTPAFEAFQAEQKKAASSLPSNSPVTKTNVGKTSTYEAFLASQKKAPAASVAAPTPAPKPTPEPAFMGGGGYADSLRQPKDDLTFGSSNSTLVTPTKEQSDKAMSIITPVVKGGQAVSAKLKDMRKSQEPGTKLIGALGDSTIETAKGLVQKLNDAKTPLTILDFGLNAVTLGGLDFVTGAAPEAIGSVAEAAAGRVPFVGDKIKKQVGAKVQSGVQYGMEKVFRDFLHNFVGGGVVKGAEAIFGDLSPEDQEAIKDMTTIGTVMAGFKAIEVRGQRIEAARSASDMIHSLAASIGIDLSKPPPPPPGVARAGKRGAVPEGEFYVDTIGEKTMKPDGDKRLVKIHTTKSGKTSLEVYTVASDGSSVFIEGMDIDKAKKKFATDDPALLANRIVNPFVDYDFKKEQYAPRAKEIPDLATGGIVRVPSEAEIVAAHKAALNKAAEEGGQYMTAKMDAADTARKMLLDYKQKGAVGFDEAWRETFNKGTQIADAITEKMDTKLEEARVTEQAQKVREVLQQPATPKTRKIANELTDEAQFAFEQELVDMAAKNDPKLAKQAEKSGYTYERDPSSTDPRPAFFDALTNKITLNEQAIRQTLDRVWAGDVIKVGEGKTTTVFRKGDAESFEKMKDRYEKTLVEHELSHAKTITPEDMARLRGAVGNEVELNKIRKELEDRANEYSYRKPSDLSNETEAAIDQGVKRIEQGLKVRENLDTMKFENVDKEAAYNKWRRNQTRSPEKNPNNPEFRKRYDAERRILDEYKKAREAQREINANNKGNVQVEKAIKSEMALRRKLEKSGVDARKMDVRLLRERITRRLEKQVFADKAEAAKQKLRDKATTKKEAQQAVVDFMREARIPMEVRGKFLADLKNARNAEDFAKTVDEIKREYNVYERKERISGIVETLKATKVSRDAGGKNVGKYTAEVQRKLDFVRKIAKEERNSLNQQIINLVDEARAKMAKDGNVRLDLPDDVADKIELLELGGLKGQSLTQLKRTEAVLKQLIENGKTDRKAAVEARRQKIKDFISSGSELLIGSPERPRAVQRAINKKSNDPWYKRFYNSSSLFQDLTREMGGVFQTAGNKAADAVNKAIDDFTQESSAMRERLKETYGKGWRTEMADIANGQKDFGVMKDLNGNDVRVRVTRGAAMDLYMRLKEAGTREFITGKDGLAYTQEIIDRALSVLKPEDVKTADWLQQEGYAAQYKKLAPVYEKRTGIPLGNVENFAGTRRFSQGQTMGGETAVGFIEDMMDSAQSYRLSTSPQFVKSRVAAVGQLKFSDNPISDYLIYSKRAAHYAEVGEFAQEWRALLSDEGIRESIQEKYGRSFLEALQYQVDNVTRGGIDMRGRDSGATKFIDQVAGNISSSLLFNPRVWSGQLSSIFGMKSEMALLPGTQADFWRGVKNAKANKADVLKYSAAVRTRLAATPSELLSQFTGDKGRIARALDRLKEWQAVPLEKMDAITTIRGASGIFEAQRNHYLKQGFDLEKASRLAGSDVDNIITRTQSTRQYIGKSQLETGALRYFVQLKQQPTKIFRGNVEAAKLLRQGRINEKQFAAFFLWNNVVQGAAYVALRSVPAYLMAQAALTGFRAIGEDELADKKEKEIKEKFSGKGFAQDVAFNSLSNVTNAPIAGDMINTLIQNMAFDKSYEYRPSLLNTVVDDLLEVGKKIGEGKYDEGTVSAIRGVSRASGVGDPLDAIKWLMQIYAQGNKQEADAAKRTPEARRAREKKNRLRARERAQERPKR